MTGEEEFTVGERNVYGQLIKILVLDCFFFQIEDLYCLR